MEIFGLSIFHAARISSFNAYASADAFLAPTYVDVCVYVPLLDKFFHVGRFDFVYVRMF